MVSRMTMVMVIMMVRSVVVHVFVLFFLVLVAGKWRSKQILKKSKERRRSRVHDDECSKKQTCLKIK